MTTKYCGMELRERIVAAREDGHSASDIAKWYRVSKRSVECYWTQYLQTGSVSPQQWGGYRKSKLERHEQTLRDWIQKEPDLTLEELQERCLEQLGIKIGITALWERLDQLGLSFKKTLHAGEQDRPDIVQARKQWRGYQKCWDVNRLVFIDETGLNTKMTRLYGRALRSERCVCKVPHGHWHTNTFIAGLRTTGLCAPWLLDGPMNGDCFKVYIEEVLGPTLSPGDIVICDNLSCHRSEKVRQSIESRGAQFRFLPAYSPDLNPIEMVFSKLKALLRKKSPREIEALFEQLREVLVAFSSAECINYFRHAQYATN